MDEPLRHKDTELKTINNITETADTEVDEPLRHEDTELKTINDITERRRRRWTCHRDPKTRS